LESKHLQKECGENPQQFLCYCKENMDAISHWIKPRRLDAEGPSKSGYFCRRIICLKLQRRLQNVSIKRNDALPIQWDHKRHGNNTVFVNLFLKRFFYFFDRIESQKS
jgi:hypothetical protein